MAECTIFFPISSMSFIYFRAEPLRREGREGFFVGFVMILEEGPRIITYQALKGGDRMTFKAKSNTILFNQVC